MNKTFLNVFGTLVPVVYSGSRNAASLKPKSNPQDLDEKRDAKKADPAEISWTFEIPGGRYAIMLHYASKDERPCELIVNGKVVQEHAAFEATESEKIHDWRYQCHADFDEGANSITLRSALSMPAIKELAIVEVDSDEMLTVDEYWSRRKSHRASRQLKKPLVVVPASFQGAVDVVRRVSHDDAAIRRLNVVFSEFVKATQIGVQNGQAAIPWGGPLNGQRYRQQIFAAMMSIGPDVIIETGTYVGASTAHFARQGLPVYTCESQDHFFARAISNLTEFSNVHMHLQDSRAFLRSLAEDPTFNFQCPFFYLDAHWYDDLPLAEEISIIRDRWQRFMIMVDDFQVPNTKYGFDRYANGLELTLDYLRNKQLDLSSLAVLFPTACEGAETSVKRGTLMLCSPDLYEEHLRFERTMYRFKTS